MNLEKHKEIVRHYLLEMNTGANADLSKWEEIIHPNFQPGTNPKLITQNMKSGRDEFRKRIENLNTKVPDLEYKIISIIAEKDEVMVYHDTLCTNINGIWGLPPSNIRSKIFGFHRFKFKDEKIITIWLVLDTLTALVDWGDVVLKSKTKGEVVKYVNSLKNMGLIPDKMDFGDS